MQIKNLTNIMIKDNEFDAQNMYSVNIVSENAVMKTVNENIKSMAQSWYVIVHQILIYGVSFVVMIFLIFVMIMCVKKRKRIKRVKTVSMHKSEKNEEPIVEIEWDEMRTLMQSSRTSTNLKGRTCDTATETE